MNIKDFMADQELVNNLAESLGDISQDSSAKYALWVISRSVDEEPTDEFFIYEFDTPEEAVAKAEDVNFKFIEEQIEVPVLYYCSQNEISHFSVEVETVVPDPDDEESTINVGTIYRREIGLDGETIEDEDDPDYGDPIVATSKEDFELLEDGTLKLSAKCLKGFNKNDIIRLQFLDEPDSDFIPYKIVSKVIYEDGDYYHCELCF